MAFSKQVVRTPTSIGKINHVFIDEDGTTPNMSIRFVLEVLDQLGVPMSLRRGDETPHTTAAQRNQLISFANAQRTKIDALTGGTVGVIYHILTDGDGSNPSRKIRYFARVGGAANLRDDEQPLMTGGQISAALTFLDQQRAKAVSQILP